MNDPLITGQEPDAFGQPVGLPVADSGPAPFPPREPLTGHTVRLEPLHPDHAPDLASAFAADPQGRLWAYMPVGPFPDLAAWEDWVQGAADQTDPQFYAITVDGKALGQCSYLRITPAARSIEIGWIALSPALQRSVAATEVQYLMMRRAFELGYRRYEWKCNALNAASRAAALRLGFTYEGTFRQAAIVKGRNRDTAWFSILDSEWPALKSRFETWLDPANFDGAGQQIRRLQDC